MGFPARSTSSFGRECSVLLNEVAQGVVGDSDHSRGVLSGNSLVSPRLLERSAWKTANYPCRRRSGIGCIRFCARHAAPRFALRPGLLETLGLADVDRADRQWCLGCAP